MAGRPSKTTPTPVPRRIVTRNRAQCAQCRQIVESTHRHDFRACGCGSIFVDGGTEYIRWGERQSGDYIDMCEFDDAAPATVQDYIDAAP